MVRRWWPTSELEWFNPTPSTRLDPADLSLLIAVGPHLAKIGVLALASERVPFQKTELLVSHPWGARCPARLSYSVRNRMTPPPSPVPDNESDGAQIPVTDCAAIRLSTWDAMHQEYKDQ